MLGTTIRVNLLALLRTTEKVVNVLEHYDTLQREPSRPAGWGAELHDMFFSEA